MPLRQRGKPFLNRERSFEQLVSIDLSAAEFVPEPEESGMLGQPIAAESLHRARLGELHDSQQIAFQVSPAEWPLAGVVLQVCAEAIAAQDASEHGSQQAGQYFAAAGGRHRIDHVPRGHKGPQEALRAASRAKTTWRFTCQARQTATTREPLARCADRAALPPAVLKIGGALRTSAAAPRSGGPLPRAYETAGPHLIHPHP